MRPKTNFNDEFAKSVVGDSRLLLHVCCAPCLATALEKLRGKEVVCLFFNPNIRPRKEFEKRKQAVLKLVELANAGEFGEGFERISVVVPEQEESQFFDAVKGMERLGEHSERCSCCMRARLLFAFDYAKKNGFLHFATTLTSSPHKSAEAINAWGKEIGGDAYLTSDFKKQNGALFAREICDKHNIFRQNYCGCDLDRKAFDPFFIGDVLIPSRLLLAPMAGYTDVGFRHIAKLCGAGLTYTEMVSAKALAMGSEKTKLLLETTYIEVPKAVQLFGSDVESFCNAALHPDIQKFDILDINMGCPMPKIVKNGDGSALMDRPDEAEKLIRAVVACAKMPVTVKFRKANSTEQTIEFAKMCERAGASAITVHGRTREQLYGGKSDRKIVGQIVCAVDIPVIYSGDILSAEEAEQVMAETGVAAVMIGRGAVGNPGIFGKPILPKDAILLQARTSAKFLGEKQTMLDLKKHLVAYFKGERNATEIRKKLIEVDSISELENVLFDL